MTTANEDRQDGGGARPRRQRRKEARPSEIVEAAITLFGEHGYGATKMEDVARRAGVAKGTLFVYFPTKPDLFRAVAQSVLASHLGLLNQLSVDLDQPLKSLLPTLLDGVASAAETRLPQIMRLLIAEARVFPELARTWHDEVVSKVLGLLTAALARAQARGEVRSGDPYLQAFSIMGPMLAGALFREIFGPTGGSPPDLHELANQHAQTALTGLLASPSE